MTDEKKSEQGEVDEPQEAQPSAADESEGRGRIAAEDVVGAEDAPTGRQLDRPGSRGPGRRATGARR